MNTNPPRYPLAEHAAGELSAVSGRAFGDIRSDTAGELSIDDLRITGATLRAQAEIARQAGHPHLADNLIRAAELTAVPNDEVLRMYEQLRPGRATYDELIALAARLEETYHAPTSAALVREAASEYQRRGLARLE